MNNPVADMITQAELASLRSDIRSVLNDGHAGSVTVIFTTSSTAGDDVDLSTGLVTADETTAAVPAIRSEMMADEGKGVQVGDVQLLLDASELRTQAVADPAAADRLTIDDIEHELRSAAIDPTRSLWVLHARAVEVR